MKHIKFSLSPDLQAKVEETLSQSNTPYSPAQNVPVVIATFHHETGKRAYLLGYHPQNLIPESMRVDTGFMVVGLFMEESEMKEFEGAVLSFEQGYIELGAMGE